LYPTVRLSPKKECDKVSLERVLKALTKLGLSQREARVYVYLATEGPRDAENTAENLGLSKQQLSSSLKSLQRRKIVISTFAHPYQFRALPFNKAMALLMKAERVEVQQLEQNKEEILSEWHSIIR
jgi:sugar-specific transcriptional regulator TrmB